MNNDTDRAPGFRDVPRTGVIYVMHRAGQMGFDYDNPVWANLGQGAPETGPLPGAPDRIEQIQINPARHEYGPITGQVVLRQKVAELYNNIYDGGPNNPLQDDALSLLDPDVTLQETRATQSRFGQKRDYMLGRLQQMGIRVDTEPAGTFYVWANLSDLPEPINDGMTFFKAGLEEKVITVPGVFFDVNPERRREFARYRNYCRISFGPEMEKIVLGLDGLERVIAKYRD